MINLTQNKGRSTAETYFLNRNTQPCKLNSEEIFFNENLKGIIILKMSKTMEMSSNVVKFIDRKSASFNLFCCNREAG